MIGAILLARSRNFDDGPLLDVDSAAGVFGDDGGASHVASDWQQDAILPAVHRLLQDGHRGRTVLTVLYLCVLGLCFVVPVFYYFRMHCEERNARRLRELELAGITQALEQSQHAHREESRAARRKFREERKARINQLFAPVKMVLKEENFPHLRGDDNDTSPKQDEGKDSGEADTAETSPANPPLVDTSDPQTVQPTQSGDPSLEAIDEDQLFIEIPSPGFQFASTSLVVGQMKQRLAPNVCSICLCNYYVGNSVVWSSNAACEHVFHEHCILQWIMKQREGPLCPCCRRDFVLDPYDMEDEEIDPAAASLSLPPETIMLENESGGEDDEIHLPAIAGDQTPLAEEAAAQEAALALMRMEEGLSTSSSNSSRQGAQDALDAGVWSADNGGSGVE